MLPLVRQPDDHVGAHAPKTVETKFHDAAKLQSCSDDVFDVDTPADRQIERTYAVVAGNLERVCRLRYLPQAGAHVLPQLQTHDATTVPLQRPQIAEGLGRFERLERIRGLWNREVRPGVRHELEEHASVGAALVELPGRMLEAWAVAHRRRQM